MSNPAGAVRNGLVLRLSVPAAGDLRPIAGDLASKIAEQLGVKTAEGGLATALDDLARGLEPGADDEVAFEFRKLDRELQIEARSGSRASRASVPLSA
ncbi:MAG: hypothetical protein ABIP65_06950 [Vicinamibacterales bacterium]